MGVALTPTDVNRNRKSSACQTKCTVDRPASLLVFLACGRSHGANAGKHRADGKAFCHPRRRLGANG